MRYLLPQIFQAYHKTRARIFVHKRDYLVAGAPKAPFRTIRDEVLAREFPDFGQFPQRLERGAAVPQFRDERRQQRLVVVERAGLAHEVATHDATLEPPL
jgi:hypothetical protein